MLLNHVGADLADQRVLVAGAATAADCADQLAALDEGKAAPDLDDLVELGTLLAALSESVMAVNSEMMAKARLARDATT